MTPKELKAFNRYWFWQNLKYSIPWQIRDTYYKISCFFFPRQRWLTKTIPREWTDKFALMVETSFACFKAFVDLEEPFKNLAWSKEDKEFILAAYKYITEDRQKLKEKIEKALNEEETYQVGGYWYWEAELDKNDTFYLVEIIKMRGRLWT